LCILGIRLQELIALSRSIIDTAAALPPQADPPHNKLQKQLRNLTWYKDRYNHYIGHQARLCHENAKRKDDLQRLILDPTLIMMTIDLAMKFLSLRYREAMNDWFGKKGIAWQGVWALWYDTTLKEFLHYDINQISNESKEDGEMVAQNIATAVIAHRIVYPQHTKGILNTDGAGCYSGLGCLARIGYIKDFQFIDASTGESGGGKSEVDRNFGVHKANVGKGVIAAMGTSDVTDAQSLADVLNSRRTSKNTSVSYVTSVVRGLKADQPIKTAEVIKAKLQSASSRTFKYDPVTNTPVEITLRDQSCLGNASQRKINISSVWPSNVTLAQRSQAALTSPSACLVPSAPSARVYVTPDRKIATQEEIHNRKNARIAALQAQKTSGKREPQTSSSDADDDADSDDNSVDDTK
jgi:hypothetical protein